MKKFLCFCVMCLAIAFTNKSMADEVECKNGTNIGWFDCLDEGDDDTFVWKEEGDECTVHGNENTLEAKCKKSSSTGTYVAGEKCKGSDIELPGLIEDKYVRRCVATKCKNGYEVRDGWCQKKQVNTSKQGNNSGSNESTFKQEQSVATVYFPNDISELSDDVSEKISSFLKQFSKTDIERIIVLGGASCAGTDEHNKELAKERTQAVKDNILQIYNDISVDDYSMAAADDFYKNDCDEQKAAQYRMVRIYVVMKHVDVVSSSDDENSAVMLVLHIQNIINEFAGERSVWKDAEGNFNTARLVSDSVAGVVLGTAGAVITSKIVKKNQIEQGFEDLKCVVGGQEVAGWGDEFNVGLSTY
ncbi:MAG: hypothetical protein ACLRFI_01300 [Alphaproteobacteria bacterium]